MASSTVGLSGTSEKPTEEPVYLTSDKDKASLYSQLALGDYPNSRTVQGQPSDTDWKQCKFPYGPQIRPGNKM